MDERPKKPRGPLLWLAAQNRWFWLGVILFGLWSLGQLLPRLLSVR